MLPTGMRHPLSRDDILRLLAPSNVYQPATMLWRVFEIEAIQRHATLAGRGVDIGCGDGELAKVVFAASEPRPTLVGVEPDERDCASARASGTYAAVHCVGGEAVPEPDASFDFAFSNSTLEHIPVIEPVLREAARLIRSGGTFLFTVPSDEFHRCLHGNRFLERRARGRGMAYTALIDQRLAHHRYLGPDGWTALLRDAGFSDALYERYFPRAAVRTWEWLSNLTGGLLFEVFGARRATRQIQHGLGLSRRSAPALARVVETVTRRAARAALAAEVRPGEPSGGLLVIATRG